jgi:hypothetical protein
MLDLAAQHLRDAAQDVVSLDARYALAYGAVRLAAETVMLVEGYRPGRGPGAHAAVFAFLRHTSDDDWSGAAAYYDAVRRKRNVAEYERSGQVTVDELDELLTEAKAFVGSLQTEPSSGAEAGEDHA